MFVTCVESPQTSVTNRCILLVVESEDSKNAVFDKFLIILALLINSANVIHRMISFCLFVRVYTSDVRVYLHIVELWSHVKTYVKARCNICLHSRQPFRGIWVVYR